MIWAVLLLAVQGIANAQVTKKNVSTVQPDEFFFPDSRRCCEVSDEEALFRECIQETALQHRNELLHSWDHTYGPKLGVVLVTELKDTASSAFSFAVKEAYAEYHGYALDVFEPAGINSLSYEKLDYIRKAMDSLNGWARNSEYIVFVHGDAVIVDLGMRIEKIFSKFKRAHFIVSEGLYSSKISTSFFIVRNTQWAQEFLDDWLRMGKDLEKSFDDSEQYARLVDGDEEEYDGFVKVLPHDALNTEQPASLNFKSWNQVLNINEEHEVFKNRVFSEAFHELCRVDESYRLNEQPRRKLPHQIDLSPENLVDWGIMIYHMMYDTDIVKYSENAVEGLNDATTTGELGSILRNVVRLLESEGKAEAAQALREKTFKEMYLNFKRRRHLNNDEKRKNNRPMPDWLNLLDHVTLIGSEYASKITDEDHRKVASKIMLELANELASYEDSGYPVQERLMNIHMDLGMIDSHSSNNEEAIKHFVEAVRIGRVLLSNKVITEVTMFYPLSFAGDAFAKAARHKEAVVMYGYALDIGNKHMSKRDIMVPILKLQYGISCYYDKRYRTAKTYIEEGLEFLTKQGGELDEDQYHIVSMAIQILDLAKTAKYDKEQMLGSDIKNEF